ncbi:MAG: hypothetical protein ACREIW_08560 [Chthoniobacterales bacterium]
MIGQIDDFQDGTTQNWTNGGIPPTPPIVNIPDGGPGGAGDNYIQVTSLGGQGAGNRLITFNRDQWLGDYIGQGVTSVEMDLKNFGNTNLSMRIGFKQEIGPGAPGYVSPAFFLPAGSGWQHVVFTISMATMIPIDSPLDFNTFFSGNFQEVRILNALNPDLNGEPIVAQIGIDNIHAVPEPSVFALGAVGAFALLLSARNGFFKSSSSGCERKTFAARATR